MCVPAPRLSHYLSIRDTVILSVIERNREQTAQRQRTREEEEAGKGSPAAGNFPVIRM